MFTICPTKFNVHANIEEAIQGSSKLVCLPPVGVTGDVLFAQTCWEIWNRRNTKIFEDRIIAKEDTSCKAITGSREWTRAQQRMTKEEGKTRTMRSTRNDERNETGVTRINTDAAWCKNRKIAGLGWILEEPGGGTVARNSKTRSHTSSPLMAEAHAMVEALKHAKALERNKIRMFSDSLNLILAINSKDYPTEVYGTLHEISDLALTFDVISFEFVSRRNNKQADELAKRALGSWIQNLIISDV